MSSVSSISSLLSGLLLSNKESSSTDDTETMIEKILGSSNTDTVSLSNESLEMVKTLFNSLGSELSESDDTTDYMYDILMSALNKKLIQNNPDLVNIIIAADESDETSIDDIDLVTMSSDDLLSIIEKYARISGTKAATSSEIDETV